MGRVTSSVMPATDLDTPGDTSDLDGPGARRHQHVEGAQQVPLRADALGNANLSEAAYVQPPIIVQIAALDNPQLPVSGPCPRPGKALVYVC